MIVYDLTSMQTLLNVRDWLSVIKKHEVLDVPKFLVGNKSDLITSGECERAVVKSDVLELADEY